MRFFIAGGGCYGDFYVSQLLKAHERRKIEVDKIFVVDKIADCQVARKFSKESKIEIITETWENFGHYVIAHENELHNDHWVPTPIGPHIIFHWVKEILKKKGHSLQKASPQLPSLPLPYFQWIQNTLVLSHAPGVCPTTCVEPIICPLTKATRDWEMSETVKKLPVPTYSFICQHFAHAVGTIPFQHILSTLKAIENNLKLNQPFGIATISSCHGLIDFLQ